MWTIRVLSLAFAAAALFGQAPPSPANSASSPPGDAALGKGVFEGKGGCLNCHLVGDNGSRFGPDLTDIGTRASVMRGRGGRGGGAAPPAVSAGPGTAQASLQRSLLEPDADIQPQNRTVRLVKRDGVSTTARMLNQDTFTVQVIDTKEQVYSVEKSSLREFTYLKNSPMPSYRDKLTSRELADLIAYLLTLKGTRQ